MKKTVMLMAALSLSVALPSGAAEQEDKSASAPPVTPGKTSAAPALSEIPVMKAQGERMATLMEQLSKESDPEIRRRIMAEAICPQ